MKTLQRFSLFASIGLLFLTGCQSGNSNKRTQVEGVYHAGEISVTDADGNNTTTDRGADIVALINSDRTIYTIAENPDSKYTIASTGRGTIIWGIKRNQIFSNIATCSIEDIKSWKVTLDDNGLPTAVSGINPDWVPDAVVDSVGMSVLALQDAFKAL